MKTTKLTITVDESMKAQAEKAAALQGHKSLTDYVVSLMSADAAQVIAEHESITLENDVFDRFMLACNKARKPNKALRDAAAYTNELGIK